MALRAVKGDTAIEPASVQRYLETKFGDELEIVVAALTDVSQSVSAQGTRPSSLSPVREVPPGSPCRKSGLGGEGRSGLGLAEEAHQAELTEAANL